MKINLQIPINQLGYGVAGCGILNGLLENNVEVFTQPIGTVDTSLFDSSLANLNKISWPSPTIKVWHQNRMDSFTTNKMCIGFPFFELNSFSKEEKDSLQNCDLLLTTSDWGIDVIESQIDVPVKKVHLGVDKDIFYPISEKKENPEIVNIFNAGKWEIRKGHDLLIRAFNSAFNNDKDVYLHMLCDNPFTGNEKWEAFAKSQDCGDRIVLHPRQQTQYDVADLMRACDIGVFPYRAEGWNFELIEMLSCGKPCLATRYSAPTEYTNFEKIESIENYKMVEAFDGVWFDGSSQWAEPDFDEIVEKMKIMVEKTRCQQYIEVDDLVKDFTWKRTGEMIIDALS